MGLGFWVLVFISNFFSLHVDLWVVSFWVSNFFSQVFGSKDFSALGFWVSDFFS